MAADMSNLRTFPGGFQVGESADTPGRAFLAATAPWSSEATHYATQHSIREVHLNVYAGWTDTNLEFLRDLPLLEALHIAAGKALDLTPLYDLAGLKLLGVAGAVKGAVDFGRLQQLRELRLEKWDAKKFASAFECVRLAVLALSNYPGPDLSALAGLRGLEELRLSLGKVSALQGLAALRQLRRLTLQEFNHLESLAGIEGSSALEELWIYRAKKLKRLDGAEGLANLKSITLTAVPEIESLHPLTGCRALEKVILLQNTSVRDGDLACLKALPNLQRIRFTDRAHYNAHLAEFAFAVDGPVSR